MQTVHQIIAPFKEKNLIISVEKAKKFIYLFSRIRIYSIFITHVINFRTMKTFKTSIDSEFALKLAIALITWAAIVVSILSE